MSGIEWTLLFVAAILVVIALLVKLNRDMRKRPPQA